MNKKCDNNESTHVRLDKWLWVARFYKTRQISREFINSGKIQYNGQKAKPSKIVEIGATIKLRQGYDEKTVVVEKVDTQRRGASEAALLYKETEESIRLRQEKQLARKLHAQNPSPEKRPTKKQRRDIIKFQQDNN